MGWGFGGLVDNAMMVEGWKKCGYGDMIWR